MQIRLMNPADKAHFQRHFDRHILESGANGVHFMPYDLGAGDQPGPIDISTMHRSLGETGWQRWFVAIDDEAGIIGHADLKGSAIRSGLHRCLLGIGIESGWRGQGVGLRLMTAAIEFARQAPELAWVDLGVFSDNVRAIALYQALGFGEVGRREDCFRIGGQSITDITMVLDVA